MDIQTEGKPWRDEARPRRILAIRLQAHGDTVITLPYLQALKDALPHATIDLLTRREFAEIPRSLDLFREVYALGGGRSDPFQRGWALALYPRLRFNNYDLIVDLQANHISGWLLRKLKPRAWSVFDKIGARSAGERTRLALAGLGLGPCTPNFNLGLISDELGLDLLRARGWRPGQALVVLNPAGFFVTRNWPLGYYIDFARAWERVFEQETRFLVLGIGRVKDKAAHFSEALGDRLIDLSLKTSPAEAFSIVKKATLIVSEDSGLMHMAWVNGAPTIAILGSTRADWCAPQGPHAYCFHAGDLECGPCMAPRCIREDLLCLTRVTPDQVVQKGLELVRAKAEAGRDESV